MLLAALLLSGVPGDAPAQDAPAESPQAAERAPEAGRSLEVYLLTVGPGEAIWERFGHNAIWIRDVERGTDEVYNWGIFDFASADFIPRLVRGRMEYWMEARPLAHELRVYGAAGREVWAQRIALEPARRAALRDFLEWNARPENRFYRYDYYRDNCSTRVRDALDRATGGLLRARLEGEGSGTTYRWHTRRALRTVPPAYLGIQVALGNPADREITRWEEAFVPELLRVHLRELETAGPDGTGTPLVAAEWRVLAGDAAAIPESPPQWILPFLGLSILVGLGILLLAPPAGRGHMPSRVALGVAGGAWSALAGISGTVLILAWAFTDHTFWGFNENLLQTSPLSLLLAILLPLLFLRRRRGRRTVLLAAGVALLSLLGLLIQPLPGLDQANGEVLALAVPLNLALAWAAWEVSRAAPAGGLGTGGETSGEAAEEAGGPASA